MSYFCGTLSDDKEDTMEKHGVVKVMRLVQNRGNNINSI